MESGGNKKLNILIISSGHPNENSPKMAIDMLESLRLGGHHVNLLLKYKTKVDSENIISVFSSTDRIRHVFERYVRGKLSKLKNRLIKVNKKKESALNYYFFNKNEDRPPVPSSLILRKIEYKYDLILIFFWQGMLSSKSLLDIYNKLHVPIFLLAADMFPMTGGCSYFWDCRNFESSCGRCPAFSSVDKNDFTNKIYLYKKNVYNSVNCIFLGNSWMTNFAKKSNLFKNIDIIYPVINENIFSPKNKRELKANLNLSNKTVLFLGSVDIYEERKGFRYLVKALDIFSSIISQDKLNEIVLIVAGKANLNLQSYFRMQVIEVGYLSYEKLAEYYALSDIFLSPSIQDAGPMMVNQSLMCGTPVVAFNMGTASDLVNMETGYLAEYKDENDFCAGILKLVELSNEQKEQLSFHCREIALMTSSYDSFRKRILDIYELLKNN